jgi:hypothetical protein
VIARAAIAATVPSDEFIIVPEKSVGSPCV